MPFILREVRLQKYTNVFIPHCVLISLCLRTTCLTARDNARPKLTVSVSVINTDGPELTELTETKGQFLFTAEEKEGRTGGHSGLPYF